MTSEVPEFVERLYEAAEAGRTSSRRSSAGPAVVKAAAGRARWRRDADVVVVGSGAAGISVALAAAARGLRVLVVTKDLVGGATALAQGGLAAAIGPGDTAAAHVSDTLTAGAGLCEPGVVAALAGAAPGAIDWLTGLGAQLETRALRLEGGHSAHRIVHSGDDATGAEVHRTLLAALLASPAGVLDRTVALELLTDGPSGPDRANRLDRADGLDRANRLDRADGEDGAGARRPARATGGTAAANAAPASRPAGTAPARRVTGLAAAFIGADGRLTPGVITARAVVIAAGGLGQAFGTTSNPAGATGDGIAVAARAGAVIRDLEFVQFHPTVLWLPGASGQCPLVTEALRGAGAVLRDLDGTPLMAGHDPRGDLAPRDVVAARMAQAIAAGDAGHVWLDATALSADLVEHGFPTVTAACRKHGIDPVTELIPVAPGAHYSCGGILADLDGRTTLAGLYAAGEAASTGVQGANRLASNSVTEAVIAGRRAGAAIADALAAGGDALSATDQRTADDTAPGHAAPDHTAPDQAGFGVDGGTAGADGEGRAELAAAMSRWAGVIRDADGLGRLVRLLEEGGAGRGDHAPVRDDAGSSVAGDAAAGLDAVEAANLRTVSRLIAAGAQRRTESRGCHRRRDAVGTAAPRHTLAWLEGQRLVVTEEEL